MAARTRSAGIKVNLTPELYERLRELAERQGQTAGSLAAVAVGQYVSAHTASLDAQREMQRQMMVKAAEILERMPQQLLEFEKASESQGAIGPAIDALHEAGRLTKREASGAKAAIRRRR